jgi:hypothetical protein
LLTVSSDEVHAVAQAEEQGLRALKEEPAVDATFFERSRKGRPHYCGHTAARGAAAAPAVAVAGAAAARAPAGAVNARVDDATDATDATTTACARASPAGGRRARCMHFLRYVRAPR